MPPATSPARRWGCIRDVAGDVSMALALLAEQIRHAFPNNIESLVDISGGRPQAGSSSIRYAPIRNYCHLVKRSGVNTNA